MFRCSQWYDGDIEESSDQGRANSCVVRGRAPTFTKSLPKKQIFHLKYFQMTEATLRMSRPRCR